MAISASMVKELREKTGAGMMDCKKALTNTDGDMDKAVEWLRENGLAESIEEQVKNSAYEIIAKKDATYYGIAMVVKRICQAIVRDEKSIFPISLRMHGEYALEDVVLSMPAIVGARGIETTIPISLDEKEVSRLHESAEMLRETRKEIR